MTSHSSLISMRASIACRMSSIAVGFALLLVFAQSAHAQEPSPAINAATAAAQDESPATQNAAAPQVKAVTVTCSSKPGERASCAADTSKGVVLLRSMGDAPCLLGRTWGYDQTSVWVSDGCSAEFGTGLAEQPETTKPKPLSHIPNVGFLLFDGEKGQIYFRLFSYARYLNQRNLDESYVDAFGNTKDVTRRQDVQLQKFFAPFSGWFLTPKMRYYLYVWSSNASQGDRGAGRRRGQPDLDLQPVRERRCRHHVAALRAKHGGSVPVLARRGRPPDRRRVLPRLVYLRRLAQRRVPYQGQVPGDVRQQPEHARRQRGAARQPLRYAVVLASYGCRRPASSACGTRSATTTITRSVATRIGLHYTHSLEEKQSQPGTEGIENSQIRLTDGSVIFTPDLFGPGITVNEVDYRMSSVDAGVKYKGLSLEGEYYWRWLSNYAGVNTSGIPNINDHGYQLQASAMAVPKALQLYFGASQVFGQYGDQWEVRGGENWYVMKERGIRLNGELMYVNRSPVGYTAYPYPVGARGPVFHVNLEMNF